MIVAKLSDTKKRVGRPKKGDVLNVHTDPRKKVGLSVKLTQETLNRFKRLKVKLGCDSLIQMFEEVVNSYHILKQEQRDYISAISYLIDNTKPLTTGGRKILNDHKIYPEPSSV